jgi:hypothetical protein
MGFFQAFLAQFGWFVVVACAVLTAPSQAFSAGGHGGDCCLVGCECCPAGHHLDGATLCRWKRTWHGPNSNWRPLTPYYVPRPPDPCLHGGHAGSDRYGCGSAGYGSAADFGYEPYATAGTAFAVSPGLQPGMERLGQIPNDVGIAGSGPMTPIAPQPARHARPISTAL